MAVPAACVAPELSFEVEGVEPMRHSAAPAILVRLRIERLGGGRIESISLQAQLRIAAARRRYDGEERERLAALFGRPGEGARGAQSLHWTNVVAVVPRFDDGATIDMPVGLTYDLEVAAAHYLHALREGDAPLDLLFSGTVFYPGAAGRLQAAMIPWDREARARLPVRVWREAMDAHFPGSAWLRIDRRTLDRLQAYRTRGAFPSWERALEALIEEAER